MTAVVAEKVGFHILLAINKQNNMHATPPHTHIAFIMPHPKRIGNCHTRDNRCFNCKYSHSNRNELSSLVIPVPRPFNDSVINPPQLSGVCQQSSRSSHNTTQSHKLLFYLVILQMIRQISCRRRPPRTEVAIFMDAWWICRS